MKYTVQGFVLVTAGLVGCAHGSAQTQSQMNTAAADTAEHGQQTGEQTVSAARDLGGTVVHAGATAGNAVTYGVTAVGAAAGSESAAAAEQRAQTRMENQAAATRTSARAMGHETAGAATNAGQTVVGAGQTTVRGTEYGAQSATNTVTGQGAAATSSAAPRNTAPARGGGPSAAPPPIKTPTSSGARGGGPGDQCP